jgi:DNA (cytosine-5)-methyltransferase 1
MNIAASGPKTSLRVLDLFAGGGGSSYGARAAGCEIVAGVDAWDIASKNYRANFGQTKGLNYRMEGDSVRPEVLSLGRIDLLLASPECTSHTCARGAKPKCDDSRMTAWQVLHHARALSPRWIIVENVVQMRTWDRYPEWTRELRALGYNHQAVTLDASEYGVAQSRRRMFVVCGRDSDFSFAQPPPSPISRTVRDILDPAGTWAVSPLYKQGRAEATLARAQRAFDAIGADTPFLLVYYGSDAAGGWQPLDRPLRTMTTLDRFALVERHPVHGHSMRMLQVPELKRAMGFGDDYVLTEGSRRDHVKVLGNGVCPPVMQAIIEELVAPSVTRHRSDRSRPLFELTAPV